MLDDCGADAVKVRTAADLAAVDALVIPGGESTTIGMLIQRNDLEGPLRQAIAGGLPVLGTCAGMILLASEVLDGRPDQLALGAIDMTVRRNAFGRQVDSFESPVVVPIVARAADHGGLHPRAVGGTGGNLGRRARHRLAGRRLG